MVENGWTEGRIDGQMEVGRDRQTDRQMDRKMNGWTDGRMDGWRDGRMKEWKDEEREGGLDGRMNRRMELRGGGEGELDPPKVIRMEGAIER